MSENLYHNIRLRAQRHNDMNPARSPAEILDDAIFEELMKRLGKDFFSEKRIASLEIGGRTVWFDGAKDHRKRLVSKIKVGYQTWAKKAGG